MKKIVILFCLLPFFGVAQKLPGFGFDKVRIVEPDRIIQADTKLVVSAPEAKSDRFYYWYSANVIHTTQGGFSGKLLNGLYSEYYLNKNLKEQGNFKNGLKDGVWKSWNEDGTLKQTSSWKNGLKQPEHREPWLNRINPFKKKKT